MGQLCCVLWALAVADGRVLLQSGAQGGDLLGQCLQLPCSLARPEGAVEVVGAVGASRENT